MMDSLLLYKILKNRTGAEISASGNPATLPGTLKNNPMNGMKVFGWSKQERTTGAQLFDASRFDGIEQYGVSLTVEDGAIYAEGTPTQNAWITAKLTADEIKKVFKNGKLTIKSEKVNNCNFTVGLYFEFIPTSFAADGSSIELTLPENIADGCIYYYVNLIKDTEMIGGCKIMLYQDGNGTWEPYTGGQPSPNPDYPQQIVSAGSDGKINLEVHGKNLFDLEYATDINNWKSGDYRYIPYYVGKGNKVSVSYSEKLPPRSGFYAVIGPNKGNVQRIYGWLYHSDADIGKTQFTFTAEEDYIYLNVAGNNIVQSIKELKKIQIEVSSAPTTYEPYRTPQSLSINTPTGLPAIPVDSDSNYTDANGQQWISDYVDLKRGKYVQRVWQKTFDGSESWGTYISTGYYLANILPEKMSNRGMLCDQLRRSDGGIASDVIIVGAFNANTSLYIENSTLRDNTLADKGLSNWKAHLAEHPLTVMTYLNTPIERNLTPEEIQAYKNLVTYAGTTIVENDAECYMEVSAGGGDTLRAKKLALILGD